MKLLHGRTVTDTRKVTLTAAEIGAISDADTLVSIAVPADTLVTSVFVIADELDTDGSPTLEIDVGHDGYVDFDGATVAADADGINDSSDITETGGQLRSDTILMVGTDPDDNYTGTTISVVAEGAAATANPAGGSIRVGYIGVAVPSNA